MSTAEVPSSENPWLREIPWIDRDDADIDAYVATLSTRPDYDLAGQLRNWRDRGLVTFENVVPQADIDATLEDIAHLRANFSEFDLPIEIRGKQMQSKDAGYFPIDEPGVKINHLHCFSRAAARLSLNRTVVDFLTHVFQGPPATLQSLTFWRGSQQPVHIDYPYVRQQQRLAFMTASWIPLEDVTPDSGPLAYYPGGHKIDKSGFFDWGDGSILHDEKSTRSPMEFAHYLYARMKEKNIEQVVYCPKKGDALIWHGNLPHEGTKVTNPEATRKSFVTHYSTLQDLPQWMHTADGPRGVFQNGGHALEWPWVVENKKLPSWWR